jgi:hypothetical protein
MTTHGLTGRALHADEMGDRDDPAERLPADAHEKTDGRENGPSVMSAQWRSLEATLGLA